jgi:rod shape determining protein RodA
MNSDRGLLLFLRQFDYPLLIFLLLTTGLGLLALNGSTHDVSGLEGYTQKQAMWWGVSVAIFFGTLLIPYRWYRYLGWALYAACVGLLLMLLVAMKAHLSFLSGVAAGGAASWLEIKLGSFSMRLQPSEFTKIAVVMILAQWLAWRRKKLTNVWECIPPLFFTAIPMAIIFKQPDFGTAAVFLPIPFTLLFVAGLRWKIVVWAISIGGACGMAGIIYLSTASTIPGLKDYQVNRIKVFLGPLAQPFRPPGIEEGLNGGATPPKPEEDLSPEELKKKSDPDDWNIRQAEMALGSGQMFGKGWRQGTQSRYKFLPEHYTDFIYSSLGEQFGLLGCAGLLVLYLLLTWRAIHISIVNSDPFGKFLVIGLLCIFLIHIFLNVGMEVRLLPVTGLPLPLVSYGGSFLATNYLLFGLIANVGMYRRIELMSA